MVDPLEIDSDDARGVPEDLYSEDEDDDEFQSLVSSNKVSISGIRRSSRAHLRNGRVASINSSPLTNNSVLGAWIWLIVAVVLSILLYQVKGRLYAAGDDTPLLVSEGAESLIAGHRPGSPSEVVYDPNVVNLRNHPPPIGTLVTSLGSRDNNTKIKQSKFGKHIISGNIGWLLDFSIVGFPKCGTSFLKYWLNQSESIYLDDHEIAGLSANKPGQVANHFYDVVTDLNSASDITRKKLLRRIGMKNPADIDSLHALGHYQKYFPSTKLVVLLRHPVWWFQSFYNFRYRNKVHNGKSNHTKHDTKHDAKHDTGDDDDDDDDDNKKAKQDLHSPDPTKLLGSCWTQSSNYFNSSYSCTADYRCNSGKRGVCTNRAKFHHAISRLGLTALSTTEEWELLDHHKMSIVPTGQDVLFLELTQLNYEEKGDRSQLNRNANVHAALQAHLGVDDLPPLPKYNVPYKRVRGEVDICDEQYAKIRQVLVGHGERASNWIQTYLLSDEQHREGRPAVKLANKKEFIQLVELWKVDPCAK